MLFQPISIVTGSVRRRISEEIKQKRQAVLAFLF